MTDEQRIDTLRALFELQRDLSDARVLLGQLPPGAASPELERVNALLDASRAKVDTLHQALAQPARRDTASPSMPPGLTQEEQFAWYFERHADRAVRPRELAEVFPQVNANSRGSALRRLLARGVIVSRGRGLYQSAALPSR